MKKSDVKNYEKSIRARWGSTLAKSKRGYTPIVNTLLEYYTLLEITDNELVFIIQILSFKWTVENPYPSLNTIAKRMGKSRGTTQGYARSLEAKGLLQRIFTEGQPNHFNFSPLIKILEQLEPYLELDRGSIKNIIEPYLKLNTKEDALKRSNNNNFYSIKEIMSNERQHSI